MKQDSRKDAKTRKTAKKAVASKPVPVADYGRMLGELKTRIQHARLRAVAAVNTELLRLYWDIGRVILANQKAEGWGAKVVERLSADLRAAFPEQQGLSPRNLKYMRAFAAAWPNLEFVQQAAAQLKGKDITHQVGAQSSQTVIVQRAVAQFDQTSLAQVSWGHHCTLLNKLNTAEERLWYASQAVEHGWSRNVLEMQIESGLHRRQGRAVTNFAATLPPPQSDLAQAMTKDPYVFDFLTLTRDANERALELGLVAQVEKFLLELGVGFSLVGRQVRLDVDGEEFFLDLLFYHLELRCFIVIDLKTGKFTPEAVGKMNFYLSAVDSRFRKSADAPTIGLILCRSKSRIIAEYALRDVRKPVGVADYVTRLVETLPPALEGAIPSVREIEEGLSGKRKKP